MKISIRFMTQWITPLTSQTNHMTSDSDYQPTGSLPPGRQGPPRPTQTLQDAKPGGDPPARHMMKNMAQKRSHSSLKLRPVTTAPVLCGPASEHSSGRL